jgi:hypothetical protein
VDLGDRAKIAYIAGAAAWRVKTAQAAGAQFIRARPGSRWGVKGFGNLNGRGRMTSIAIAAFAWLF